MRISDWSSDVCSSDLADVEHAHPLAQPELAADQVELGFLRIIEVLRLAPVAAAVDQALAEHGAVEVVAQVVVALADLVTAASGLQVEQARTQCGAAVGGSGRAVLDAGVELGRAAGRGRVGQYG